MNIEALLSAECHDASGTIDLPHTAQHSQVVTLDYSKLIFKKDNLLNYRKT